MESVNINLLWMITGTFAALSVGTAIRLIALRNSASDVVKQRIGSLKVWWILALLWSVAALVGQIGAAILLAMASFFALREYLRLLGTPTEIGLGTLGLFECGWHGSLFIDCRGCSGYRKMVSSDNSVALAGRHSIGYMRHRRLCASDSGGVLGSHANDLRSFPFTFSF